MSDRFYEVALFLMLGCPALWVLVNGLTGLEIDLLIWAIFIGLAMVADSVVFDVETAVRNGVKDLTQPREVHHYHRITIDQNGNPVEVTQYVQRD